jgi:hypothetical protein
VAVNWFHNRERTRAAARIEKGFMILFVPGALAAFTFLTLEGLQLW